MNLSEHILNELNKVKFNYIQPKHTILKEVKTGFNMHPTYWKSFILFKKN